MRVGHGVAHKDNHARSPHLWCAARPNRKTNSHHTQLAYPAGLSGETRTITNTTGSFSLASVFISQTFRRSTQGTWSRGRTHSGHAGKVLCSFLPATPHRYMAVTQVCGAAGYTPSVWGLIRQINLRATVKGLAECDACRSCRLGCMPVSVCPALSPLLGGRGGGGGLLHC